MKICTWLVWTWQLTFLFSCCCITKINFDIIIWGINRIGEQERKSPSFARTDGQFFEEKLLILHANSFILWFEMFSENTVHMQDSHAITLDKCHAMLLHNMSHRRLHLVKEWLVMTAELNNITQQIQSKLTDPELLFLIACNGTESLQTS